MASLVRHRSDLDGPVPKIVKCDELKSYLSSCQRRQYFVTLTYSAVKYNKTAKHYGFTSKFNESNAVEIERLLHLFLYPYSVKPLSFLFRLDIGGDNLRYHWHGVLLSNSLLDIKDFEVNYNKQFGKCHISKSIRSIENCVNYIFGYEKISHDKIFDTKSDIRDEMDHHVISNVVQAEHDICLTPPARERSGNVAE